MIHFDKLRIYARAAAVFSSVTEDEGVKALLTMCALPPLPELAGAWAAYFKALSEAGCADNSTSYMRRLILRDENVYSRAIALKQSPSPAVSRAAERELSVLYALSRIEPSDFYPSYGEEELSFFPSWSMGDTPAFDLKRLNKKYGTEGFGIFTESTAFVWESDKKEFLPVKNVNPVRLKDLKEYAEEKAVVTDNTLSFIQNLPANNVLLYGDRGTGKSSTVHAVLNEFAPKGLRLVEVQKSGIGDFPLIIDRLRSLPNHFIIFIDDLTFIEGADDYAALKAALEGSVSKLDNVLIYATTNRRHLLKESHADRSDDVHSGDTIQEQLSLSDRFGLVVTFINPNKREFLTILKKILSDRKIKLSEDTLSLLAERYTLRKGGRSPRAAKQLADMIESRVRRGLELTDLY